MQLARAIVEGTEEFAVRDISVSKYWTPLSVLGQTAADTEQAISLMAELGGRPADVRGTAGIEIADADLRNPVIRPGKILAIGLNYTDHIKETGAERPRRPVVFAKYASSLTGPFSPVLINKTLTQEGDYESELAVVIGRRAKGVSAAEALSVVFGYAVANDVSARDWQREDAQFSRSKSFDTFCPIGPWITTADEVPDPQNLAIRSYVNDEIRQNSSTKEMIFSVAGLISYLSATMTLHPGDVILTGTPAGVGVGRRPPAFLQPGDVVRCEIAGLGAISSSVVDRLQGEQSA
jgi:2-keto-4-pentenoate hydratase/2-oxohepta-3-ene-1,7-dioic acid hydratase in catechol pathway